MRNVRSDRANTFIRSSLDVFFMAIPFCRDHHLFSIRIDRNVIVLSAKLYSQLLATCSASSSPLSIFKSPKRIYCLTITLLFLQETYTCFKLRFVEFSTPFQLITDWCSRFGYIFSRQRAHHWWILLSISHLIAHQIKLFLVLRYVKTNSIWLNYASHLILFF